jgi:hypothetical protein
MDKITNLSKACKEFFIDKANDLSIVTGFIKRRRKITGSSFIRALVVSACTYKYKFQQSRTIFG